MNPVRKHLSGRSLPEPRGGGRLELGVPGFTFADLFEPGRLGELHEIWMAWFRDAAPEAHARFEAYRACRGKGMTPTDVSEALLAAAPFVSGFIARLFRVEAEVSALGEDVRLRDPRWGFKRDFAKKRVLKADAGKAWVQRGRSIAEARTVATLSFAAALPDFGGMAARDEELAVARATHLLFEVDDVARKAAKAGGAQWTPELRARAGAVRAALLAAGVPADAEDGAVVAFALDAIAAYLAARVKDREDRAHRWPSLHAPRSIDFDHLVELRRNEPETLPELFTGPEHERRQRAAFALTAEKPLAGPFDVNGTLVIVRLKERKDPDLADFENHKIDLSREAELTKWERVLTDWMQARCVEAKAAKRINVNTDVLRYEDSSEPPPYEPCVPHRQFGG